MRKFILIILTCLLLIVALFYFDAPLSLARPVFHTEIIVRYAQRYELDPLLVTALIKVESNFFRRARSHRGAIGLMQLMPATAGELARDLGYKDFKMSDLEDPDVNIHLGTYYLYRLHKEFTGNTALALAAYNAGRNKVRVWYRQDPLISVDTSDIPYPETRGYVKSVMRTYRWLKNVQKFKSLVRLKTR